MNVQTLKSKLLKGEVDGNKEVVAVIDNKEYNIIEVTKSPGKAMLVATLKEGIHVGESIEDEKPFPKEEGTLSLDAGTVPAGPTLEETKELITSSTTVAEDIQMDKRVEAKKKKK
tara:strand:- start:79 stop:423 length:345 start_codon:yes stop_codon:yes gene_type:complete